MKYYDGMGRDVSDYVAGLEQTIAELKAKLELAPKASTLNLASPEIVGNVKTVEDRVMDSMQAPKEETVVTPKPRRRTEQVADA